MSEETRASPKQATHVAQSVQQEPDVPSESISVQGEKEKPLSQAQEDSSVAQAASSTSTTITTIAAADTLPTAIAATNDAQSAKIAPKENPPAFDFSKFKEEMKAKGAEAIAGYLRSFLVQFSQRQMHSVDEQQRTIFDFYDFIIPLMQQPGTPWSDLRTETQFQNSKEGLEKLVIIRLYAQLFSPQFTDDEHRDRRVHQRISMCSAWIEMSHLDVKVSEDKKGTVKSLVIFAAQEMNKINKYAAPRDKLTCILNACKIIYEILRSLDSDGSADSFLPILIYILLKANPKALVSNIEFINRFSNPSKLQSEAGYYLSSLTSAVAFIESLDFSSLSNITRKEFEDNVANAIAVPPVTPLSPILPPPGSSSRTQAPTETEGDGAARPLSMTLSDKLLDKETISRPLRAFGKFLQDTVGSIEESTSALDRRLSGAANRKSWASGPGGQDAITSNTPSPHRRTASHSNYPNRQPIPNGPPPPPPPPSREVPNEMDRINRQISRLALKEREQSLQTLLAVFPGVDEEVRGMVLDSQGGDLAKAIEALLDMNVE